MKTISILLWELDEKDIAALPDGFPVLRYDKLTESITVLHAHGAAFMRDRRYVYLLYRQPSIIPENEDGEILQACGSAEADPRMQGEVSG